MTQQRRAGVLVEIFPSGTPGITMMQLKKVGPVILDNDEVVRVLTSALAMAERARDEMPDV